MKYTRIVQAGLWPYAVYASISLLITFTTTEWISIIGIVATLLSAGFGPIIIEMIRSRKEEKLLRVKTQLEQTKPQPAPAQADSPQAREGRETTTGPSHGQPAERSISDVVQAAIERIHLEEQKRLDRSREELSQEAKASRSDLNEALMAIAQLRESRAIQAGEIRFLNMKNTENQEDIAALKADNRDMKATMEQTLTRLQETQVELSDTKRELRWTRRQLEETQAERDDIRSKLEEKVKSLQSQVDQKTREIHQLQQQLADLRKAQP